MNNIIITLAFVLALCSCGGERDPRPTVAVTIEPLRYFAERIGGDRFRVVTMVPGGASPETYEPTAQQMAALADSRIYIMAGSLGFERTWTERLKANAEGIMVVNSSEGIRPVGGGRANATDPHTWTSPANAVIMARNICRAMTLACAKDSAYFRANLDSLTASITAVDARIRAITANAPCRTFIIYHPALTYFARDYGFEQLAIEENGREPSPASLERLIGAARQAGARTLFVQREFGNRNTATVASATGARVVDIDPLGHDWEAELIKTANALCEK